VTVRVIGDADLASAPRLRAELVELHDRGHRFLELDLSLVDFLDSTSLGVLLGAVRRARQAGGDLTLIAAGPAVVRLITLLRLGPVLGFPDAAATP